MSSDIAIKVENLSKCYHIYDKPRDRLAQMFFWGRRQFYREFWALKDLSLEIKKGETVGIIGRNGSGKSTLLQLICGTLAQTSGTIQTRGRIAALLELGSGFNPEFTGRENVYLNASILGLTPQEIDARYEDIVHFADIGDHMEQSVKTYSSGMVVRLAFAVIAHVDADILVVDEALAVGDAIFTQKCMRYIRSFRQKGTLLFVSHDTNAVINLCDKAIWLDGGEVREQGLARNVAQSYLQYSLQQMYGNFATLKNVREPRHDSQNIGAKRSTMVEQGSELEGVYKNELVVESHLHEANGWKSGAGEIVAIKLELESGEITPAFRGGERVRMVIRAKLHQDMASPILGFLVRDRLGQDLFGENTLPFTASQPSCARQGDEVEGVFGFTLPMLPNGDYAVMASLADGSLDNHVQHHWLHDALILHVSNSNVRWGLVGISFHEVKIRVIS